MLWFLNENRKQLMVELTCVNEMKYGQKRTSKSWSHFEPISGELGRSLTIYIYILYCKVKGKNIVIRIWSQLYTHDDLNTHIYYTEAIAIFLEILSLFPMHKGMGGGVGLVE